MARPLRIQIAGGRYYVTSRGNERRPIFRDDRDRSHFLELLSELPDRLGARIHGWVLMDNHYHLLLETPEPNLSRVGQWLNVAYSVWFNRRHDRSGHLFQGRFHSLLVGEASGWLEVARYAHLNPVRVARLGLGKADRQRTRSPAATDPGATVVAERLRVLRSYRWSSYRAYSGEAPQPPWLVTDALLGAMGRGSLPQRRKRWREFHEQPLREGHMDHPWDRVVAGAVLAPERVLTEIRKRCAALSREIARGRELVGGIAWDVIVQAVESAHRQRWEEFRDRHGDWGRDMALYLGRIHGRLRLTDLGLLAGGIGYTAVAQAISRVRRKTQTDPAWRLHLQSVEKQLSKLKM